MFSMNEAPQKKAFVQTWGCQMNVADSERMSALLRHHSYKIIDNVEEADLIILNTCHIREKADHKVVSQLGIYEDLKKRKHGLKIVVAGCLAQMEADKLKKRCPAIDLLIGPDQIEELPDLLGTLEGDHKTLKKVGFDSSIEYDIPIDVVPPWPSSPDSQVTRFVNIIKGCDNFCSFCVVPFTRGREKSRSPEQIQKEVEILLSYGAREIVLLGQNVNSYGLDRPDWPCSPDWTPFSQLLLRIAALPGLKWLRFTTSNPHDFTHHIPQAFKIEPRIANSFHLPLQSGSNRILDLMRRKYTREVYFEKVAQLREVRPDIAITTDLIVGFPGETERDFEETLDLVQKVRYSQFFAFKYSPRRGTAAARLKDQIPEDVKSKRLNYLFEIQKPITREQNLAYIDRTVEVLVQYPNSKADREWYGRTYEGRLVRIQNIPEKLGPPVGTSIMVKIEKANETALQGVFQAVH